MCPSPSTSPTRLKSGDVNEILVGVKGLAVLPQGFSSGSAVGLRRGVLPRHARARPHRLEPRQPRRHRRLGLARRPRRRRRPRRVRAIEIRREENPLLGRGG